MSTRFRFKSQPEVYTEWKSSILNRGTAISGMRKGRCYIKITIFTLGAIVTRVGLEGFNTVLWVMYFIV